MKVVVVGAGISGVLAGAHLRAAGIDVTVFERSAEAGGVWLYDERLPPEPKYPSTSPSEADLIDGENERDVNGDVGEGGGNERCRAAAACEEIEFAPPGPAYEGLSNNVTTREMKVSLLSWPPDTPDFVNHRVLNTYIQEISRKTGVHEKTVYGTRVEKIEKREKEGLWRVKTSCLRRSKDEGGDLWSRVYRSWTFDAVIVASGHYHACRIPDIPGLVAWKKQWPDRVQHSKSYRHPSGFKNQNVLLVGAGVSSTDIAKEIAADAKNVYQISRGGAFDLPTVLLPKGAIRINGEIRAFETITKSTADTTNTPVLSNGDNNHSDNHDNDDGTFEQPIPGRAILTSGHILTDLHRVILCTGYHISLPFLRHSHHSDRTPVHEADDHVLVTDGTQYHNLHKDIFYIPDPSLAFVGVPYFSATFSLFEFQAMAVAAVFSKKARVPEVERMKSEYRRRVSERGYGKRFHSLKEREVLYVNELVEWVNEGRGRGEELMQGHTPAWLEAYGERVERMKKLFGGGGQIGDDEGTVDGV